MEREGVSIDADGIKAFGKEVSAKAEKSAVRFMNTQAMNSI